MELESSTRHLLHVRFAFLNKVLGSHSKLRHHDVSWGREAEPLDTNNLSVQSNILVPHGTDTGLHSNPLQAGRRKDRVPVLLALLVEEVHRWHGNNADAISELLGSSHSVLNLGSRSHDDHLEGPGLLLGDVSSLQHTLTPGLNRNLVESLDVLTSEDDGSGTILALLRMDVGSDGLLGVSRADDVQVGEHAERRNSLDRLMGGTVLANTDGVVSQDVGGGQFSQSSHTDGSAHVIDENQEGGARWSEQSMEGDSIHDGSHTMLADSKVEVLSSIGLVKSPAEVSAILDVVLVGSVKIGRTREELRHEVRDVVDHDGSSLTGGNVLALGNLRNGLEHLFSRGSLLLLELLEKGCFVGIGRLPGIEGILPCIVLLLVPLLNILKMLVCVLGNLPRLSQAESLLGFRNILHAGFTVSSVGTSDLVDSLADDGLAHQELRLAVLGGPELVEG
mmetsp:Transcript_15862/g.53056  ORF Transcript_15862/g.53056 Transcript_15862/m.53056 type:complete len:449 (+) Transcript_15862:44-1390(+)